MESLNPASGGPTSPPAAPDPNPVEYYEITRAEGHNGSLGRVRCWVFRGYGVRSPLPHLMRHSPDGFEIGYGGSGPADLARSILADHLDTPDVEPAVYQAFKHSFLSHPEHSNGRIITVGQIEQWLGVLRSEGFQLEAAS